MKGIYLHGYQGFVTEEKKLFLDKYCDIYAPQINYDYNPTILYQLLEEFQNVELDFVSGTSLGGILAFHLAILLKVPCLLFNPAVTALEMIKDYLPIDAIQKSPSKNVYIVIGEMDEIISPIMQENYFKSINISEECKVEIVKHKNLGHAIPLDIFEHSFKEFFKKIQYK